MDKVQRALWRERLAWVRGISPIVVIMLALIVVVSATSLFLQTEEPVETDTFIGVLQSLREEPGPDGRRYFVVRLPTGDAINLEVEGSLEYREGAEVRLSRGIAGGGRIVYDFVGYLEP